MYFFWALFFITISSLVFSENGDLIKETAFIANAVFTKFRLTAVVWWHCEQDYVNDFVKTFRGTAVVIAIKENINLNNTEFHKAVLYKQTVFFALDSAEFEYFLKMIKNVIVVSIRVIVVITNKNIAADTYNEFTRIAWEQDVTDIILLGYNTVKALELKTYHPYTVGACGNFTSVNLKRYATDYFTPKFRNFYGCPIRVSMLDFMPYVKVTKVNGSVASIGGIDGNVLNLIIEILNASMEIISADHKEIGGSWANSTRDGIFSDVVNGIADVIVPAIAMTSTRYRVSQVSYAYKMVNVAWYLPNRREIFEWARVLLPFLNFSTLIILLAFVIILTIIKVVEKFEKVGDGCSKGIVFAMFGVFFGQEVNICMPHWFVNSLFNFWVWFCLIVRISYQGNLIDGLQKTILEAPIKTLSEAVELVEKVGGLDTFLEFYRNTSVENKYTPLEIKAVPIYLKEIAAGKKFLLAADMLQVIYLRQNVQILDERVTNLPSSIHMRARWPAASELSRRITRLTETGFIEKMWRNLAHDWYLENNTEDETLLFYKPLGLKALTSCFYGLILMSFISSIVFCIEIVLGQQKKKLKSLRKEI